MKLPTVDSNLWSPSPTPFTLLMIVARCWIAAPRRAASRQPASSVMFQVSHTRGHSLPDNTQQNYSRCRNPSPTAGLSVTDWSIRGLAFIQRDSFESVPKQKTFIQSDSFESVPKQKTFIQRDSFESVPKLKTFIQGDSFESVPKQKHLYIILLSCL